MTEQDLKPETLFKMLGCNYTARHVNEVNEFLASGETDVKILLDKLGGWDEKDFAITQNWYNSQTAPKE